MDKNTHYDFSKFPTLDIGKIPMIKFAELTNKMEWNPKYERIPFPHKTIGQLKLLLGELQFMTYCSQRIPDFRDIKKYIIVYIGSSPGNHIPTIDKFFPGFKWEFIDPAPISNELLSFVNEGNGTYTKDYADDKWAESLLEKHKDKEFILISDIRSTDEGKEPTSKNLMTDYKIQWDIVNVLKPKAYTLKWRCPFVDDWPEEPVLLYPGELYLQAFAKPTSCELRCISFDFRERPFQISKDNGLSFEQLMCYYNVVIRRSQLIGSRINIPFHDHVMAFDISRRVLQFSWGNFLSLPKTKRKKDEIYTVYKYIINSVRQIKYK